MTQIVPQSNQSPRLSVAPAEWRPAVGPLMTRWSKLVSPTNALPEYPRPQMTRPEWQNLNGLWDYAVTDKDAATAPAAYGGQILVPYSIESALSGVMKPFLPTQKLWYRRTFTVPADWRGQSLLLHFGAVDWEATVWVNGHPVGSHQGGYDEFTFDITGAVQTGTAQELVVSVLDPSNDGEQACGKQTLAPAGCSYTASSGIWQTVWLEPVPTVHIERLQMTPDLDASVLRIVIQGRGASGGEQVEVQVQDSGRVVAEAAGGVGQEIVLPISRPRLWSPDSPFLYDLTVTLKDSGSRAQDTVQSYFGMRSISVGQDVQGVPRLLLNGEPLFQCGPLDQGFWPDSLHTAPTDDALLFDLEYSKSIGFNMIRKHVKVEPARWYHWADNLGVLVWQDMPAGPLRTPESRVQWEREMRRHIEDHRNHPSIILWVLFNEGWGQHDTERLVSEVRDLDGTRLIINASGWHDEKTGDEKTGDVLDKHFYPGPGVPRREERRALVTGEFGGLGYLTPDHLWKSSAWGYQTFTDQVALTEEYVRLWQRVYKLSDEQGLSAAVYTQISDVEEEANGLLTYDRAAEKMDRAAIRAAHTRALPARAYQDLVPTSRTETQTWRCTTEKPPGDWAQPEFDAVGWEEGAGGFGVSGHPEEVVGTEWSGTDLWLRRDFTVGSEGVCWPLLEIYYGVDADVYLNGILACSPEGFLNCYGRYELNPPARATLQPGRNVFAVHVTQRHKGGDQYIDLGLIDES